MVCLQTTVLFHVSSRSGSHSHDNAEGMWSSSIPILILHICTKYSLPLVSEPFSCTSYLILHLSAEARKDRSMEAGRISWFPLKLLLGCEMYYIFSHSIGWGSLPRVCMYELYSSDNQNSWHLVWLGHRPIRIDALQCGSGGPLLAHYYISYWCGQDTSGSRGEAGIAKVI